jgi:hypothetical protein
MGHPTPKLLFTRRREIVEVTISQVALSVDLEPHGIFFAEGTREFLLHLNPLPDAFLVETVKTVGHVQVFTTNFF